MSLKTVSGCMGLLCLFLAGALAAAEKASLDVDLGLPQVLSWVPPVYPQEAIARKLEGQVAVRFIVDETGAVTKARAASLRQGFFRSRGPVAPAVAV